MKKKVFIPLLSYLLISAVGILENPHKVYSDSAGGVVEEIESTLGYIRRPLGDS